jgi:hypothetical protein
MPSPSSSLSPVQPFSGGSAILPAFLLVVFLAQCAWFIRTQSFTNDEPEHIVAGLEAWRFGEFQQWSGHPPLGRMLVALPLLNTSWQYQFIDHEVHPVAPAPEVWLYRARPVVVMLGVAMLLLLWATARQLFSETTANFVLALAVLSPDLVAHFSLATTDGIACLFLFACVVQWLRYWYNPSWIQATIFGVLSGCLLLAKYNGPPLLALLMLPILVLAPGALKLNPEGLQWRKVAAISLIAWLLVWSGFFFHVSRVVFANRMVSIHFAGYTRLLQYDMPTLKSPFTIFIPACEWLTGLGWRIAEDMQGHRAFLLGHYSKAGFTLYFPAAMLLKWPFLILFLGVGGAFAVLRRRVPGSRDLLLISLIPAVYLLLAMKAPVNIGVRHVLPLYPFLLLYAGAFFEWSRHWHWDWRKTRFVFLLLLVAQAADVARYAPDYLSYFTIFVRPANTWRLLSDSNTDWGQGMFALRQYQAAHPGQPIHLAYAGEVDPAWYGIRYTRFGEDDRPTGIVVVSATHLSGQLLQNHAAYRWLLPYPTTVLNHTLYVFDVPQIAASAVAQQANIEASPRPDDPICTPLAPRCHTEHPEADRGDGSRVTYAWP